MNLGDFEVSIAVVAFAVTTAAVYIKSRFDRIDRLLMTPLNQPPRVDEYEAERLVRLQACEAEAAKMNALVAREAKRDQEIATTRWLLECMMREQKRKADPYR